MELPFEYPPGRAQAPLTAQYPLQRSKKKPSRSREGVKVWFNNVEIPLGFVVDRGAGKLFALGIGSAGSHST